jgi:hypothetical protein
MSSPVITVAFDAQNRGLNRGLDDSSRRLRGFDRTARQSALGLGTLVKGFAAFQGIRLAKDFLGSAITQASNAQQSLGATETVFKSFSKTVVNDSKRASKAFGLSSNEYRENANLIGSLFKNQGVASDELAGKSKAMIKVASDLAATFGGTTKDAVESLGAAYKGEFNQLEKYGISLKQSTINTEAMKVANVKSTSEFNKLSGAAQAAAKQQATTNLVLKQSKDSTGAFARETGTLAHQQQVLSAQFDNVKSAVGSRLLPALTSVFQYMTEDLPVAYGKAKEGLQRFLQTPVGMKGLDLLKDAAGAIGDGFDASIKKLDQFKDKIGSLDLNNLDGKQIGKALSTAVVEGLSGIAKLCGKVASAVGNMIKSVDWVGLGIKAGPAVIGLVIGLATGILNGIGDPGLWSNIWNHGFDIAMAVLGVAFAPVKIAGKFASLLARIPLVGRFLSWLVLGINGAGQKVLGYIANLFRGVWNGITAGSTPGILKFIATIVTNLRGLPGKAVGALKSFGETLAIRGLIAADKLGAAIRKGILAVVRFLGTLPGKAVSAVKGIVSLLPSQATSAMSRMASAFSSGVSRAVGVVRGLPGRIKGAVSGAAGWLVDAASNTIAGFVNGMKSKAAQLIPGAVSEIAGKVKSGFKKALSIFSPSRVTRELGEYVTMGLAIGMLSRSGDVVSSVNSLSKIINEDLPRKIKKPKAIRQWYKEHNRAIAEGSRAVLKSLRDQARAQTAALVAQRNEYAASVRDAAAGFAGLSNLQLGENENLSAGGIQQFLSDRLASIANFNNQLAILKSKGISNGLYDQIVQMGVEQGTGYAQALASATPQAIAQVNYLQSQISVASAGLGNATAQNMYGAGVAAAQGFENGLNTLLAKVAKQGIKIGKSLIKSLKKALGIKSPSKEMLKISNFAMAGMLKPLDANVLRVRGAEMAQAFATGYANSGPAVSYKAPKQAEISAQTLVNSGGGGTTVIENLNVQVDANMSPEQYGKQIKKAIKAAEQIGL